MRDYRGRTVFITGAAGGLGRAICRRFGAAGARIAATDLSETEVAALVRALEGLGIEARGYVLDVTDEEACRETVSRAASDFGRLDVLVNNAGISQRSAFADTHTDVYRRVMGVNFFGSLYCAKAALGRLLESRGQIVVISSVAGFTPLLARTGYSASKHALHGLFESLRTELAETGVTVTMVCPTFVATNINVNALDFDGRPARRPQQTVGKVATPEATADFIFKAAAKNRRMALPSTLSRLSWIVSRLSPALFERLMTRSVAKELQHD